MKYKNYHFFFAQLEQLRNTIFDLESQLNRRNNEYVDLVQMDQADRANTLEAIRNQYSADHDIIAEKDVSFFLHNFFLGLGCSINFCKILSTYSTCTFYVFLK